MKKVLFASFVLVLSVSACNDTKKVSFDTVEQARSQAKANAEWNATSFRATTYPDFDMLSRGDSSQLPECPQGDGWASIDLISKNKIQTIKLKCSTVSPNIGCLTESDFKSKAYAQDDGKCQSTDKVPFPLPKIAK